MNDRPSLGRRLFFCLAAAVLVWSSFPSFWAKTLFPRTAFLGWIALIPFFSALKGSTPKQGAFLGYAFGFLQFGGVLYWIAFIQAAEYLKIPAWFVLVAYLSLYPMVFGALYCWLSARAPRIGAVLAPFLWVGLEYIRGTRPLGGFPWAEIGYSQAPYPAILAVTSIAGVYGLTLLMAAFAMALSEGLHGPARKGVEGEPPSTRWRAAIFLPPLALAALWAWGNFWVLSRPVRKVATVALLQPSIDQSEKWNKSNEKNTYAIFGDLIRRSGPFHPDLIIWPETGAPSYLRFSAFAMQKVANMVRGSGVPQLVGCLDAENGDAHEMECFNAAAHFDADGRWEGVYRKRHLVPFGEFVPFQKYLSFLGPVVGDLGDFYPGASYRCFQAKGFSYSPMICYEVIFPGDVRNAVAGGADSLVNISNDAWYGRTASAYQHVMMAVVRAAEERMPLLRAANTGISLATDPFGRVLIHSRLFEQLVLPAEVWVCQEKMTTPYAKWGDWLPRLCLWVMAVVVIAGILQRKKNTGPPGPAELPKEGGV